MLCILWDQEGMVREQILLFSSMIYYELLKPDETITAVHYKQQLMKLNQALKKKRPEYAKHNEKLILLHDNARSHLAEPVKKCIQDMNWEVLSIRFWSLEPSHLSHTHTKSKHNTRA